MSPPFHISTNSPAVQTAVEQCFDRVHRAALVLSGNPWDADDLTQDTFLIFAQQAEQFAGRSTVYTYLYGILLNLDRRERRRIGIRNRKLRVLWDNQPADGPATPGADAPAEVKEWKNSLWGRVADLPEAQRHVLVLRFSEGLAYEEIAEVMGCPLGPVKSRIFHALAAVRRKLDEEGDEARQIPAFPTEGQSYAV
jgi:RNA polymerase sigma-70 factor (ECF subfamily)